MKLNATKKEKKKGVLKTLSLIFSAVGDLALLLLPQLNTRNGFAFIVHPRDMGDVYMKYPFLRSLPRSFLSFLILNAWPITASRITGVSDLHTGKPIKGWMIGTLMTPELLMKDRERAVRKFKQVIKLAERKGAKFVGLGALSSSLTHGGKLVEHSTKAIIVTGRLFTAQNVADLACKGGDSVGIERSTGKVCVIGAAGSIGSATSQILVKKGFRDFTLIDLSGKDRRMEDIISCMKELVPSVQATYSTDLDLAKQADIIVIATNRVDAFLKSEHIKPGTVVVDDAKPVNVDPEVIKTRSDILVLEGGAVHTESIDVHMNIGLQHKTDVYSCLAEVVVLVATGATDKHFNLGEMLRVDFNELEKLKRLSGKLNITTGDFQNYQKLYTNEDIEKVKRARPS